MNRVSERTSLEARNCTVSSVFSISGILSLRPSARFCVLDSMNWYFLSGMVSARRVLIRTLDAGANKNVRDHLRETLQRLLDVRAGRHIVFNPLDEGRIRDATGVGRGVFAVKVGVSLIVMIRIAVDSKYPSFICSVILVSDCGCRAVSSPFQSA